MLITNVLLKHFGVKLLQSTREDNQIKMAHMSHQKDQLSNDIVRV